MRIALLLSLLYCSSAFSLNEEVLAPGCTPEQAIEDKLSQRLEDFGGDSEKLRESLAIKKVAVRLKGVIGKNNGQMTQKFFWRSVFETYVAPVPGTVNFVMLPQMGFMLEFHEDDIVYFCADLPSQKIDFDPEAPPPVVKIVFLQRDVQLGRKTNRYQVSAKNLRFRPLTASLENIEKKQVVHAGHINVVIGVLNKISNVASDIFADGTGRIVVTPTHVYMSGGVEVLGQPLVLTSPAVPFDSSKWMLGH